MLNRILGRLRALNKIQRLCFVEMLALLAAMCIVLFLGIINAVPFKDSAICASILLSALLFLNGVSSNQARTALREYAPISFVGSGLLLVCFILLLIF